MHTALDPFTDDRPVPPECRATADRLQLALDGDALFDDTDTHAVACLACRDRVRAARVLLAMLATPEPVAVPAGFSARVLTAVAADRRVQTRGRVYKAAAWLALAAAVLVGAWFIVNANAKNDRTPVAPALPEVVQQPKPVAPPVVKPPAPPPRIGDAVASAAQTIIATQKPFADAVAVAPKLFDLLAAPFTTPAAHDPMAVALAPARKTLADLPATARTGLAPVTGTAQKAFNRLLRDVSSVKPNS